MLQRRSYPWECAFGRQVPPRTLFKAVYLAIGWAYLGFKSAKMGQAMDSLAGLKAKKGGTGRTPKSPHGGYRAPLRFLYFSKHTVFNGTC